MQDVVTRGGIGPIHFAGVLVDANEARRVNLRKLYVRLVHTIRCVDEQQVPKSGDRAAAHVVLEHLQLSHHIEDPDAIGLVLVGGRDNFEGAQTLSRIEPDEVDLNLAIGVVDLGSDRPLLPLLLRLDGGAFGERCTAGLKLRG
jgi:hypothetical protein